MSGEPIVIIGGGMTGMIAQQHVPYSLILDWGPPPALVERALPKQWGANYWWKPIAGMACEEFDVFTTIDNSRATPEAIHAYKTRVGKAQETYTRPGMVASQFEYQAKGYAPLEFPSPTNIRYKSHVVRIDPFRRHVCLRDGSLVKYEKLISTIPLPALRAMVDAAVLSSFDTVRFQASPIYVVEKKDAFKPRASMSVDYRTTGPAYRATAHRDGSLHLEYSDTPSGEMSKKLIPGRIYDTPYARPLVAEMALMDIYCFGRYARWDSDELLHQTDEDIQIWAGTLNMYS